ncbi:zinc finger MYM-type protein 1-like [Corticium candelabrum]|uniref:zinc finger MYM-type protein 1-like n=1 Tax=Corticium candelabrum TaxID=121492 RepID=UPI002E265AE4|nr:zinc finger MYM-type protein 1-like [Corticium candelabrum]
MEPTQSGVVADTEKSLYRNDKIKQQSDLLYDSCLPAGAVAEAFSNLRLEGSKFSQETSPEEDHSNSTDDTAFVQSSNDDIEDMGRSLFHAAMHLRSQILSLTNRMQWPPSSNELRKPPNIPPDLFNFLAWVVNGDDGSNEAISSRNRVRIKSQRAERYVTSIAEDLIHCATNGKVKTPKHVYLPMTVRNLTSNVQIVSLLNRFGHGLSNSQMQEIDTAIAEQRLQADSSEYRRYPWLHYQEADDKVFCFYCQVAEKKDLGSVALRAGNLDDKFVRTGFTDWKKALTKFEKHQKSVFHRDAMDMVVGKEQNVGQMLGKGYAEEMVENRNMLQIIISCIRYLARQGLAMRGRSKPEGSVALERDSNLMQLLIMRAEDNPRLWKWLDKCQAKFTSPCIQNEILSIMALMILRDVVRKVSGKWYTIMVDETTDLSNTEQMVFCLRYVDDDLEVHEEVIGLYSLDSTSADSILATVQDILLRMNLRIDHCRGQCYDGASNMAGAKSGVAKRLNDLEPRALYTHCYGHALNLATQDVLKGIKVMRSALETVHEITKLIKKSPKRESIFKKFKDVVTAGSPGLRILCPTRWTVRAEALTSISENYTTLQMTWDVAKEATKDTEMRARIGGIALQMDTFDFVYGVELGRKLLNIVDNLSRSLQSSTISACEGQKLVSTTTTTIQSMRSDECFDIFWKYVERKRLSLQVPSPTLPRRRKVPRQFEVEEGATVHPVEVKEIYRRAYFEAIDLILAAVKDRFHQKGFNMLQKLETVVTSLQKTPAIGSTERDCQFLW